MKKCKKETKIKRGHSQIRNKAFLPRWLSFAERSKVLDSLRNLEGKVYFKRNDKNLSSNYVDCGCIQVLYNVQNI